MFQAKPEIGDQLKSLMDKSGALLEGHFKLSSGLHSDHYLQCALLLRYPRYAAFAGENLADLTRHLPIDLVVSPALGGLIIGHEVARAFDVPFIFFEREAGLMKLRRFPNPGRVRFLVVEDVITTGGSSKEVGETLVDQGGIWVATACIVDRSGGKHVLPKSPYCLWSVTFPVYDPETCPLCKQGLPLTKPGSR